MARCFPSRNGTGTALGQAALKQRAATSGQPRERGRTLVATSPPRLPSTRHRRHTCRTRQSLTWETKSARAGRSVSTCTGSDCAGRNRSTESPLEHGPEGREGPLAQHAAPSKDIAGKQPKCGSRTKCLSSRMPRGASGRGQELRRNHSALYLARSWDQRKSSI